jgi:branched-chain amino acid transport system substrate-binding protein
VFKKSAASKGMKVVDEQFTTDKATDFMAILTAIKAKGLTRFSTAAWTHKPAPCCARWSSWAWQRQVLRRRRHLHVRAAKLAAGAKTLGNVICAEGGASLAKMPGGTAWKAATTPSTPTSSRSTAPTPMTHVMVLADAMKRAKSPTPRSTSLKADQSQLQGRDHQHAVRVQRRTEEPAITLYTYKGGKKAALN